MMDAICRLGLATTIAQSHGALLVRMGDCYYSSVNHIRNEYYMNMGGNELRFVAVTDVDQDGDLDLAVANYNNNRVSTVSILLGNDSGTFGPPAILSVQNGARSIAVGVFNDNADPDLAVSNEGSDTVWHNRFRKLFPRYEKKEENYLGLVQLANSLIVYRRLILEMLLISFS
jgi:hypothetical protein